MNSKPAWIRSLYAILLQTTNAKSTKCEMVSEVSALKAPPSPSTHGHHRPSDKIIVPVFRSRNEFFQTIMIIPHSNILMAQDEVKTAMDLAKI